MKKAFPVFILSAVAYHFMFENETESDNNSELGDYIMEQENQEIKDNIVTIGDKFKLGTFEYSIDKVEYYDEIGHQDSFAHMESLGDSKIVIVKYTIENIGKKTKHAISGEMSILDSDGRKFLPSSRLETPIRMLFRGSELFIVELHPGIPKEMIVGFEIPKNSIDGYASLLTYESGVFSSGIKIVRLPTI